MKPSRYHSKRQSAGRLLPCINQGGGRPAGRKGIYKNESNGDVFIAAEGDKVSLDMFLDWCHEGPDMARCNFR